MRTPAPVPGTLLDDVVAALAGRLAPALAGTTTVLVQGAPELAPQEVARALASACGHPSSPSPLVEAGPGLVEDLGTHDRVLLTADAVAATPGRCREVIGRLARAVPGRPVVLAVTDDAPVDPATATLFQVRLGETSLCLSDGDLATLAPEEPACGAFDLTDCLRRARWTNVLHFEWWPAHAVLAPLDGDVTLTPRWTLLIMHGLRLGALSETRSADLSEEVRLRARAWREAPAVVALLPEGARRLVLPLLEPETALAAGLVVKGPYGVVTLTPRRLDVKGALQASRCPRPWRRRAHRAAARPPRSDRRRRGDPVSPGGGTR